MLVWKGWGFLALLIPLIASWTVGFSLNSFYGEGFYQQSAWAMPLTIGLTAIPVTLIGIKLSKKRARTLIDVDTLEKVEIKPEHSMFWIPLQYWGIIIISLCMWLFASNSGLL